MYNVCLGKKINVQAEVEKPQLYILARCPSNDQQLMYIDTRLEDIKDLSSAIDTNDGISIYDEMRFFKGDGPAAQLEAGQQKGGDFPCWQCPVNAKRFNDLAHTFNLQNLSLEERRSKVMLTVRSSNLSHRKETKLFRNISKDAIMSELHQRDIKFR